jgi:hypothetical protein
MSEVCAILFPKYSPVDPEDTQGCIEPQGHFGPHRFRFKGGICQWEYDEQCQCEECTSEHGEQCITYQIIEP